MFFFKNCFLVIIFFISLTVQSYSFTFRTGVLENNLSWHTDKDYVSIKFKYLDENFDPFGVIEDELAGVSYNSVSAPGAMEGAELSLFKVFSNFFSGEFSAGRDDYDLGWNSVNIDTYSADFNVFRKKGHLNFVFSFGSEFIKSEDIIIDDPDGINNMIKRVSPGTDVKIVKDADGYWFDRGNGVLVRSGDDSKNITPSISILDSRSISYYSGVSVHYKYEKILTGLFFEYGKNYIDTKIDTKIDEFMGSLKSELTDEQLEMLNNFSYDMERDESYFTAGSYVQFPLFFDIKADASFSYIWIDRESDIDYEPENYAVNITLIYPVTKSISLNLGGQYLYRQLNGVIPFLYNKYTQTTFDHKYGYMYAGLNYYF